MNPPITRRPNDIGDVADDASDQAAGWFDQGISRWGPASRGGRGHRQAAGRGLAVAAVANGTVVDLDRPLENGTAATGPIELRILTSKDRGALDVAPRHSRRLDHCAGRHAALSRSQARVYGTSEMWPAMVQIKLPDGSVKDYPDGVRPREVAAGIGKRLADAAVAAVADGTGRRPRSAARKWRRRDRRSSCGS